MRVELCDDDPFRAAARDVSETEKLCSDREMPR